MIAVAPFRLTGLIFPRHRANNLALFEVEDLYMAPDNVNFVSRGCVSFRDQAKALEGALYPAVAVE
jgi:hypothetical protein